MNADLTGPIGARRHPPMLMWQLALFIAAWACNAAPASFGVTTHVVRVEADRFPSVRCFATVTDEGGQSLSGLTRESFAVAEEGKPVRDLVVSSVLPKDSRVAVMLVLDRSGSMRGSPMKAAVSAASDFAGRLSETDSLGIVTFSSKVDAPVPPGVSRKRIVDDLDRMRASGETALYDAVRSAIEVLSREKAQRKAIVALTDGQDNASVATERECAEAAKAANVAIYCIGLGRSVNEKALRSMAGTSGGLIFVTATPERLIDIYRQIARELKSQYVITYTSPGPVADNSWRTVTVSVAEKGSVSSDRRQYLAALPLGTAAPSQRHFPLTWIAVILAAFALGDVMLVVAVLVRRRRRGRSAGGSG